MNAMRYLATRKKGQFSWWLSYLAVLLMSVLLLSFFHVFSLGKLQEEVDTSYSLILRQMKLSFDSALERMHTVAVKVQSYPEVITLSKTNASRFEADEILNVISLQRELVRLRTIETGIAGIYVYFPYSDVVIASADFYRKTDDLQMQERMGFSFAEIKSANFNSPTYMLKNGEVFYIIRAMAYTSDKDPVIFVKYSKATVEKLLFTSDTGASLGGNITVTDSGGNELSWTSAGQEIRGHTSLVENARSFLIKADIPSNVYNSSYSFMRNALFIYILFCLMIGAVISFYIARRAYSPVDKLVSVLQKRADANNDSYGIKFIENQIGTLLGKTERMEERLRRESRNRDILACLKAGKPDAFVETVSQYPDIVSCESYTVALIRICGTGIVGKTSEDNEAVNLCTFAVQNVIEEMLGEDYSVIFANDENDIICIAGDICSDEKKDMSGVLTEAMRFLRKNLELSYVVVFGGETSADGLKEAYYRILREVERCVFLGKTDEIRAIADNGASEPEERRYISEFVRKFENAAYAGDFDVAEKLAESVMEVSPEFVGSRMDWLRIRIVLMAEVIFASAQLTWERREYFGRAVREIHTVEEYTETMCELFDEARAVREREDSSRFGTEAERAVGYLKDRFSTQNVNVQLLADELGISTKLLAKYVQHTTQMTPIDYIQRLRLEEAKRLLADTSMNINEIAEKVGFINSLSLNRLFKKYEGISPSLYRSKISKRI